MTVAEVFATNIQIGQLKAAIPQYEWCENRFQEEKDYFLWWLNKQVNEFGYRLTDQVAAWTYFILYHSFEDIDDEDEEFMPSWMEEIEQTIREAVRAGNYSEYGGQL